MSVGGTSKDKGSVGTGHSAVRQREVRPSSPLNVYHLRRIKRELSSSRRQRPRVVIRQNIVIG
jgi:hypothetical protein